MIKLLRNFRQNALTSGVTRTYIKYAIGEIVLVVIGILIALSINNWNEERKSFTQIELLLNNLGKTVKEDTSILENTVVLHEFRSNSLAYVLKFSQYTDRSSNEGFIPKHEKNTIWKGSYPDTLNTDFVDLAIFHSGINDKVVINKNVLDELKNTGLFSAIENDSLKNAINTYYSFVNRNFIINDWNEDLTISWRGFLRDTYGVLTMEFPNRYDPLSFVKSNEPVQIRIHEMVGPARYRSGNASHAITLAEDVIREIDLYLKSK